MANPQPTDPHLIIAHDIQENLIIRDFTQIQLKIINLIIRLSWGCNLKAWQYNSYRDFEVIGLYKSNVSEYLERLHNNKVIVWNSKYKLISFNKNYDEWLIPITKKSSEKKINRLVHESLKKSNEVREILTALEKSNNIVRESLTLGLENLEHLKADSLRASTDSEAPKERLKESINTTTSTTSEKGMPTPPDDEVPSSDDPVLDFMNEISSHYTTLTGRMTSPKDEMGISEIARLTIDVPTIKAAMTAMAKRYKPVNPGDRIRAFSYFMPGLKDRIAANKARKGVKPTDATTQSNSRGQPDQYAGIGLSF